MSNKQINEEELTASSYIITFYKEVGLLIHAGAIYHELITELKSKYGTTDLQKIEETDTTALKQGIATIRYHAYKINIQYKGIISTIKDYEDELKKPYTAITNKYIADTKDIEEFLIAANNFLTKKVMASLLESSNAIIEGIYGTNQ